MPPKKRSPAQLAAASRGTAATKARRLDNFINRMADVDVVQHFIDADFVDVEAPADLREIVDACAVESHASADEPRNSNAISMDVRNKIMAN